MECDAPGTVDRMSRHLPFLWLFVACGSFCRGSDVELTGLVDLGTCRMACVRLEGNDLALTVRIGERAGDFILNDLDSRAGWAQFRRGTNEVRIWLREYCASPAVGSPDGSRRVVKREQARIRSEQAAVPDLRVLSEALRADVPRQIDPGALIANPNLLKAAEQPRGAIAGRPENVSLNSSIQGGPANSGSAPAASAGDQSTSTALIPNTSTTLYGSPAAGPGVTVDGTEGGTARSPGPVVSEADQMRGLYGAAAFLAWDIARFRQSHPDL
jgi:hypothetical protein